MIDWGRIELLRAAEQSLGDGELAEKIREDLILPNARLLAAFCEAVKMED